MVEQLIYLFETIDDHDMPKMLHKDFANNFEALKWVAEQQHEQGFAMAQLFWGPELNWQFTKIIFFENGKIDHVRSSTRIPLVYDNSGASVDLTKSGADWPRYRVEASILVHKEGDTQAKIYYQGDSIMPLYIKKEAERAWSSVDEIVDWAEANFEEEGLRWSVSHAY